MSQPKQLLIDLNKSEDPNELAKLWLNEEVKGALINRIKDKEGLAEAPKPTEKRLI